MASHFKHWVVWFFCACVCIFHVQDMLPMNNYEYTSSSLSSSFIFFFLLCNRKLDKSLAGVLRPSPIMQINTDSIFPFLFVWSYFLIIYSNCKLFREGQILCSLYSLYHNEVLVYSFGILHADTMVQHANCCGKLIAMFKPSLLASMSDTVEGRNNRLWLTLCWALLKHSNIWLLKLDALSKHHIPGFN